MPGFNPFGRWFEPRLYGMGYSPRSWEGWVLTLVGAPLIGWAIARFMARVH